MKMSESSIVVSVHAASASYDVEIANGFLSQIGQRVDALLQGGLRSGKQRCFVVSSPEIWKHWGSELASGFSAEPTLLSVPSGEEHKRLATVERLAEAMAQAGADRDSILLAFGGGVIGDMTGYLASMYMRGIRYVQIPTTLLAQVDSSIGGKTGVNLAAGKNLAGAFHHPLAVYADTAVLTTLPAEELRAGLQESIKAGIIRDRALFDFLDQEQDAVLRGDRAAITRVVADSVRVKADVVSADERESGLRMILNLGHTLGHAIEAATEYKQLLHGEAVAWGMLAAIEIAERRGTVSSPEAERMTQVTRAYGPLKPFTADAAHLVALTAKDKKNRGGSRSFVLPVGIGEATVVRDVSEAELLAAAQNVVTEAAGVSA